MYANLKAVAESPASKINSILHLVTTTQLLDSTRAKMKRKLDANDVPTPAAEIEDPKTDGSFAGLGLDSRLLQGITKQNFQTPTLVQSKAIPLALEGRDILARAKTGSGKTAAYLLPILHSVLKRKQVRSCFYVEKESLSNSRRHLPPNAHPL